MVMLYVFAAIVVDEVNPIDESVKTHREAARRKWSLVIAKPLRNNNACPFIAEQTVHKALFEIGRPRQQGAAGVVPIGAVKALAIVGGGGRPFRIHQDIVQNACAAADDLRRSKKSPSRTFRTT